MKISIQLGEVKLRASLNETQTAASIWEALPIETFVNTWGDEIYFRVPVDSSEPPTTDILEIGELAFWPPGAALCIFFGPTPASQGNEPRAASKVIPVGRIEGDATILRTLKVSQIRIQKVE